MTELAITADTRFSPDWEHLWTKEEAERELEPFKFTGPGWYLSKDRHGKPNTILAIPYSIDNKLNRTSEYWQEKLQFKTFAQSWPVGTKFWFYCYDGRNPAAFFSAVANAPTRLDER
jgi:hypothetical protein